MTTLVRFGEPRDDGMDDLASRAAELEATLGQRSAEIGRVKSVLAAFKIKYKQEVGLLHDELDDLERAIAEAELGEISKRLERDGVNATSDPSGANASREHSPRLTSDAVRKLFRDVARMIHPDLARDELARDRRHRLMIEANKAYALGDEDRLRRILHAWEHSPEAVAGNDVAATRLRLERRIAQIGEEIATCTAELAELQQSPLWKLKTMVDDAAIRGTDLVADTVRRLKRDILAARNRLDAMRLHP